MSLELTLNERLVLAQNYRLLALQDPDNQEHWERLEDVVKRGYTGLYWRLTQDFADGDEMVSPEESQYVRDVLRMFDALDSAITRHGMTLTPDRQHRAQFAGFDGNSEGKLMGYAENFSEGGHRYAKLMPKGECPNSHGPVQGRYRKMLEAFSRVRLVDGLMSEEDVIQVLSAH